MLRLITTFRLSIRNLHLIPQLKKPTELKKTLRKSWRSLGLNWRKRLRSLKIWLRWKRSKGKLEQLVGVEERYKKALSDIDDLD